jgi:hypothetical protein
MECEGIRVFRARFNSMARTGMNKKTRAAYVSAAEIVKKYGVTYQAVNHYTNLGLLEVVTKNGNMRMYAKAKVKDRLSRVSMLVNEGYSLRLIRKKLIGV